MTSEEQRIYEFLVELRDLEEKHGVSIGGCGCCGSPWAESETGYMVDNCNLADKEEILIKLRKYAEEPTRFIEL